VDGSYGKLKAAIEEAANDTCTVATHVRLMLPNGRWERGLMEAQFRLCRALDQNVEHFALGIRGAL